MIHGTMPATLGFMQIPAAKTWSLRRPAQADRRTRRPRIAVTLIACTIVSHRRCRMVRIASTTRSRALIGALPVLLALCNYVVPVTTSAGDLTTIPVSSIGVSCRVIGTTGKPLGTMVTLHGIAVLGSRFKGDPIAPKVQVQEVDGHAVQAKLEIPVRPHSTGFGELYFVPEVVDPGNAKPDPDRSLPRLEAGEAYELWGYETGSFVGAPKAADEDGGVVRQTAGFYFASEFVVVKCKKVVRTTVGGPRN